MVERCSTQILCQSCSATANKITFMNWVDLHQCNNSLAQHTEASYGDHWYPLLPPPAHKSLPPSVYPSIKPFIRYAFPTVRSGVPFSWGQKAFHCPSRTRDKIWCHIGDMIKKMYEGPFHQCSPTSLPYPTVSPTEGSLSGNGLCPWCWKGLTGLVLCPNRPITCCFICPEGHSKIAAMKVCLFTQCTHFSSL